MAEGIKNGVIVVDKPADMTSAQIVGIVKKLLNIKKAGHTGTLDPLATGVLVCCLGKATRLASIFLHDRKTYEAVLRLGVETDTLDATGTVTAVAETADLSTSSIHAAFKMFVGSSKQTPPIYSALKHNGQPLYKLARRGKPIKKPARQIHISKLNILSMAIPDICFRITCSAGTYIRTLCADIGKVLGCGGHLKALRRTESSGFTINEAITLTDLESMSKKGRSAELIIPMADALRGIPCRLVDNDLAKKILNGVPLTHTDLSSGQAVTAERRLKLVNAANDLLAVVEKSNSSATYRYCSVFPPEG